LTYGMTKGEVRRALGPPQREFVRSPQFSGGRTEWIYGESELFVGFDPAGQCESVMLCPPGDARLEGVSLLRGSAAAAWTVLQRRDPSARIENECLTSLKVGMAIYGPDVGTEYEERGEPALSVLAFRPGYYDSDVAIEKP
jgi:hypothetical protein